jgi:hypothetical protein
MAQLVDLAPGPVRASHSSDDQSVARDLEAAAEALASIVGGDDEHPARWSSTTFVADVARSRSRLSMVLTMDELVAARRRFLPGEPIATSDRELAAGRLARDPIAVAFALRALELEEQVRLAPWPDLLRKRAVTSIKTDASLSVEIWFG